MTTKNIILFSTIFVLNSFAFAQTTGQTGSTGTTAAKKITTTPTKTKAKPKPVAKKTAAKAVATTTKKGTTQTKGALTTTTTANGHTLAPPPKKQTNDAPSQGGFTRGGTIDNGGTINNNTNNNTNNGDINNRGGGGVTPNNNNTNNNTNITNSDAANAIKDALEKGIGAAVTKVAVENGYLNNSEIKIPFPQDVSIVENTLRQFGLGSLVDQVVLSLNRAAENAASQATPIFIGAVTKMTIPDAMNIVMGSQPDAATRFLQANTTDQLVAAFKPSIKNALDNTSATRYWGDLTSEYNKIPLVTPVETDLPEYVTRKAISGLFIMVAKEEANIRQNSAAQSTDILKKVFGRTAVR